MYKTNNYNISIFEVREIFKELICCTDSNVEA